jgi:hypothetical protein
MTHWSNNKVPHEIPIDVPDGVSNNWRVETFVVSESDEKWGMMRAVVSSDRGRYVPAGTYKALKERGAIIMSNTPDEIRDLCHFLYRAQGKVLINGLGLGVALKAILNKVTESGEPAVELVHVVEKSEDVLKLVRPTYESDKRVSFIHADALEYRTALKFDVVWHDIFDNICADNLPIMHRLHRKYGSKTEWQGSWCRERCESQLSRYRHFD